MTEVNPISVPGDADAGQVSMPPKRFHMFISYRVKTDGHTAERLCDKLQSCSILNEQKDFRLRCFLDKQNLTGGQNYKTQFMDGLNSSCLFLPVISLAVLAGMTGLTEDVEDNVVLEWETALEMHSQGQIAIFPILVGDVETTEKGTFYRRFDSFWIANDIPDIHIKGSTSRYTVRQVINEIFKLQGVFVNPSDLQDKLSAIIERFSVDFWPRFRDEWEDRDMLGADPIYTCVQCLKDYTNKENGDGACRFHKSSDFSYIGGYDKVAACCLKSDAGCSRGRHRSKNHCDYPYSQFQQWMSNILNYSDASERMAKISAFDYSCDRTREVVEISVGRILRKSDDRDKLFVKVWTPDRRWFYTFSQDELELADHNKPILTVQHHTGYSAQVTWIIFDGEVQGVEISCKSITSIAPARCRVRFAWPEVSDNDGPRAVSVEYDEGPSFGELPLKSGTDYNIPKERFYKGPILKVPVGRKADDSLPAWGSPDCPLRCKLISTETRHQTTGNRDIFASSISILNPTGTDITVVESRAYAKLRVDEDKLDDFDEGCEGLDEDFIRLTPKRWLKATGTEALSVGPPPPTIPQPRFVQQPHFQQHQPLGRPQRPAFPPMPVFQQPQRPASPVKTKLPVTVPSNGSVNVEVEAYVATNFYNGNILSTGYLNFSWIAFKHGAPVVVDVEFEDIFGRLFGIMIEYPVPKLHISFPKPTDLLWLCCDIPNEYTRFEARVFAAEEAKDDDFIGSKTALRSSMEVLSMSKHASSSISSNISTATLRGIVWKALQEKEAGTSSGEIYDASSYFFDDSNQKFQLKVFTLIDVPRKSVYALKVVATARVENDFVSSSVGYVAVPPYGDALRDDPDLAIEATPCKSDFPPDDMKVLTDIVGDTTGPVQSRAVITPRLDFSDKPKAEPITSREASSSAAPPFDPSELVKTIQDAVRAEVEDAVRAAMQVQISRLKEFIKTTVKESFEEYGSKLSVVTPESSPPRSVTDIERVTDVDAIAAKFGEILKAETMAQTVRIEASMAATATAAAAVTLRQKASEDGANGGHKKKGFWNM